MAWIDEIAVHLENKPVPGYAGTVYVQTIPVNVVPAVMLAGPMNGVPIDPEIRGLYKNASLQLVVRAKKSADAETLAKAASDAVETEQYVTLDTIRVRHIRPRHLPASFPRSDGDFYEAVVNFDLCFEDL